MARNIEHRHGAFSEVITWTVAVDDKLGSLSEQAGAADRSARCSVLAMSAGTDEESAEGGGDAAQTAVREYSLLAWARGGAGELKTGEECEVTKYGRMKIRSKQQVGAYGFLLDIRAEKIN